MYAQGFVFSENSIFIKKTFIFDFRNLKIPLESLILIKYFAICILFLTFTMTTKYVFPYLIVRIFRNIFSCHCCYICNSYVIDDILVCLTGLQGASCDVLCLGKQTARQKRQVALYQVIDHQLHKIIT